MRVERHGDPAAFERLVTPLLLRDEARFNLELAVVGRLVRGELRLTGDPVLLTVHDGDDLAGMAIRTPPWNLLIAAVPLDAVAAVAAETRGAPAVIGDDLRTEAYAAADGRPWRVERRQGVFRLETPLDPPRPAPGHLRPADPDAEPDLICEWFNAFSGDANVPVLDREVVLDRARDGDIHLWDDGGPRSLVGVGGTTPNGIRVGPVYTPPEHRGRGYATSATAAVTRRLLDAGHRFTFLYTDLDNDTANRIYPTIGYERVAQVRTVVFDG